MQIGNSNFDILEKTTEKLVVRRYLTGYASEIIIATGLFIFLMAFLSKKGYLHFVSLSLFGFIYFCGIAFVIIHTNSKGYKEYIFDKNSNSFSKGKVKICDLKELEKIELIEERDYTDDEFDYLISYYHVKIEFSEGGECKFESTRNYDKILSVCDEISNFVNIKKALIAQKDVWRTSVQQQEEFLSQKRAFEVKYRKKNEEELEELLQSQEYLADYAKVALEKICKERNLL